MTKKQLKNKLSNIVLFIDEHVDKLALVSDKLQNKVHTLLKKRIREFEINDDNFAPTQDFSKKLLKIGQEINEEIFGREYTNSIKNFLTSFDDIADMTIELHKSYNELEVRLNDLTSARKFIYEQAKYSLTTGIEYEYIQPVQHLLMQQITSSASITDSIKMLDEWNDGKLRPVTGEHIPSLSRYTTQIARDTAYSMNRTINAVIANKYDLNAFIYVGDIIKDSRPICVHLVNLNRDILLSEMTDIIRDYPGGLYPGTAKYNFLNFVGGYNCRHMAMSVRHKEK